MRNSIVSIFSKQLILRSKSKQPNWTCIGCQRRIATAPAQGQIHASKSTLSDKRSVPQLIKVQEKDYETDEWTNAPQNILSSVGRQLHLQKDHPISITRSLIESQFKNFGTHYPLYPAVSTYQNFDSLQFPADHPGRSRTDTYYINKDTVLRTHTSAHQAETFKAEERNGWLISADVYRRDAVDRSHYPIFHQMEGAMTWDSSIYNPGELAAKIQHEVQSLPSHQVEVSDPNPMYHLERNPLQPSHNEEEVQAASAHLKRSLESAFAHIFARARLAAIAAGNKSIEQEEPLKMRWVEAYFPFTSPSWELEILWQGEWLEVLGCGIIRQQLLINSERSSHFGWAFGIGLERIAMLLFNIPDIRLFWSTDARFLSQFREGQITRFTPFSKHPACYKDVSFWLRSSSAAGGLSRGSAADFHENDLMELVRELCGNLVEDVQLTDDFTHPRTGKRSKCYRINYRSLERTLTNEETNSLHQQVRQALVERLGVELR
jgi:phenylalanyl-tRNA synthetase alpha chain